jgi:hypothetical protein
LESDFDWVKADQKYNEKLHGQAVYNTWNLAPLTVHIANIVYYFIKTRKQTKKYSGQDWPAITCPVIAWILRWRGYDMSVSVAGDP